MASGAYGEQPEVLAHVNRSPRYASGPTTFFRLPYEPDSKAEIGIVGVPFDGGVTNRPGARHGPRSVRQESSEHVRPVSNGISPYELASIKDFGDIIVQRPYELIGAHREIEEGYASLLKENVDKIVAVGGDHSISLPILRALYERHGKMNLIHIDAHCDTGDEYMGSRFHHGSPFKVAVDEGLIDPERSVQIGIRGTLGSPDAWKFSYDSGMRVITMDEFDDTFWAQDRSLQNLSELLNVIGDDVDPTYLTFDIDALDPANAPGTGTPEPGGMSVRQAQVLLRNCILPLDKNIVGADLVEVSPPFCTGYLTAFNAANLLHDILCITASSTNNRREEEAGEKEEEEVEKE